MAIVEEGYPDKSAMFDPMIFYDAKGDKDRMFKKYSIDDGELFRFHRF